MPTRLRGQGALLSILALSHVIQIFFVDRIPEEYQWVAWDLFILVSTTIAFILLFQRISYREHFAKIMCLTLICTWVFTSVEYSLLTFFENSASISLLRNISALLFITVVPAIIARSWIMNGTQFYRLTRQTKYSAEGCFLVYDRPQRFSELLASCFTAPFGRVSLVVNGKHYTYRFSDRRIHVYDFRPSHRYTYELVKDVSEYELAELLSQRWTPIRNNCFTTFRRFKKDL